MLEVEIKIPTDAKVVSRLLAAKGAKLLGRVEQNDIYFRHPERDFGITDEALRIRIAGEHAVLTYKGPKLGLRGKVREELDCPVEDADRMVAILRALGFRDAGRVSKVREEWRFRGALAAVDRVSGLGDFLELEVPSDEDSREEALAEVRFLAEELGLDPMKEIRKSYLELILDTSR